MILPLPPFWGFHFWLTWLPTEMRLKRILLPSDLLRLPWYLNLQPASTKSDRGTEDSKRRVHTSFRKNQQQGRERLKLEWHCWKCLRMNSRAICLLWSPDPNQHRRSSYPGRATWDCVPSQTGRGHQKDLAVFLGDEKVEMCAGHKGRIGGYDEEDWGVLAAKWAQEENRLLSLWGVSSVGQTQRKPGSQKSLFDDNFQSDTLKSRLQSNRFCHQLVQCLETKQEQETSCRPRYGIDCLLQEELPKETRQGRVQERE